jgi:hypothetical protein
MQYLNNITLEHDLIQVGFHSVIQHAFFLKNIFKFSLGTLIADHFGVRHYILL